jgi:hypothetical protein
MEKSHALQSLGFLSKYRAILDVCFSPPMDPQNLSLEDEKFFTF